MATRFFCCCLPVRLGVFVLSLLQLLFGGATAGIIWYEVFKTHGLDTTEKIAFYVSGGVYSVLAISALFGFIGAITRKRGLVSFYSTILILYILLSAAASAFLLYVLYRKDNSSILDQCRSETAQVLNNAHAGSIPNVDPNTIAANECNALLKTAKWAYIVSMVVTLLIQLYCYYIVRSYVHQLDDEQGFRGANKTYQGNVPPSGYYPHQPLADQSHSLLHPPTYPYSDPHNSFGAGKV